MAEEEEDNAAGTEEHKDPPVLSPEVIMRLQQKLESQRSQALTLKEQVAAMQEARRQVIEEERQRMEAERAAAPRKARRQICHAPGKSSAMLCRCC